VICSGAVGSKVYLQADVTFSDGYLSIPNNPASQALLPNRSRGARRSTREHGGSGAGDGWVGEDGLSR
jgi:hypothetical protein